MLVVQQGHLSWQDSVPICETSSYGTDPGAERLFLVASNLGLSQRFVTAANSNATGGAIRRVASQFFLVSPRAHFVCPVPSFSEVKEIG